MAKYVDGFVFVVPKKNLGSYRKMAREGAKMWRKFGAIDYKECMMDDPKPAGPGSLPLTFPKLVKAKKGETVWFSFVVYKSRKHRDEVNKKIHAYMGEKYKDVKDFTMPFDEKRMSYAGFSVIVDA